MNVIKQNEPNPINIQKSIQRQRFKYQIAIDNPNLKDCDGNHMPKGMPVKLTFPMTTFAIGLTIDGNRFIACREWLEAYELCPVCIGKCGHENAHGPAVAI